MKKQLLFLFAFLTIASIEVLGITDPPPPPPSLPPELNGSSSVSPGCTYEYDIFAGTTEGTANCLWDVTSAFLSNTLLGTPQILSNNKIRVTYQNTSTAPVSGTLVVNFQYWKKCDVSDIANLVTSSKQKTITVGGNVGTPNSPSITESGTRYRISTSAANATSYVWSVSGGTYSNTTGNTIYVTPSSCGSLITGTVRAIGACGQSSGTRSFSRQSPSSAPSTPSINGPSSFNIYGTFYASSNRLPSYDWQVNATPGTIYVNNSTSSSIIIENRVSDGQTYVNNVKVRASNQCGTSGYSNTLTFSVTGNGDQPNIRQAPGITDADIELYAYPNPASTVLNLTWGQDRLRQEGFSTLSLIDMTGRVVLQQDIESMTNAAIDVSSIGHGQYVMELNGATETKQQLVLIER